MAPEHDRWILCGGLASGKSAVRRLMGGAGIETIDADEVGHAVLAPDGPAFGPVSARWPSAVVDGKVERRALASIVFSDPKELAELESITHPHIFDLIRTRVEENESPVVVEMPLISDVLGPEWHRIVVDCEDEIRLRRAVDRGMTETEARARMASQPAREVWLSAADLVIPNHGSKPDLSETVSKLIESLGFAPICQ